MVGDSHDPSTGGRGQRKGRRVQGHSQLQRKSEGSLGVQSSCLKHTGAGETAQQGRVVATKH